MTSTPLARQAARAAKAKGQLRPVNTQPLSATPVTVAALILREMTATYGRRPGGYIWAILEPAAGVMILTYVFTLIARTPPLGINFAMFYATGLAPFFLFNDLSKKVGQSLNYSRNLLGYPRVTIMDAILARLILNTLTQILVAYLMREFSCDLVEHLARLQSDNAVPLDPALRRYLGVGNGSALGLIFFVQKHPRLVNAWLTARETAIATARNPEVMGRAFSLAVQAGRMAYLAELADKSHLAQASSPLTGFLNS